jgi:sugar phosphate isomerase/epimerase
MMATRTVAERGAPKATQKKSRVIWGFAGPFYGEYECWQGDQLMNQLRFIVDHGFRSMGIGLGELKEPARRDQIAAFVATHDLECTTGVHLSTLDPQRDKVKRQTEEFVEGLRLYKDLLRVPIVTTGAGAGHRFMRDMPLARRLDLMVEAFTPLAKACHDLGCPLGIENHGDFYCSDLVELCERVPHMHIFLDTGNTYLIGEKSIPACREAAPYVIGTHLKDHWVTPDGGKLVFALDGAPLGEGDVGLATVYNDIITLSKAPKLVLHWELITPKGMNALEALERSWKFVKGLPQA